MTSHQFRLHLIVPEARFPAFGLWYRDNVDPADDGSGWPRVNATGSPDDAPTHREVCTALTAAELLRVVDRLADGAVPDWGSKTPAQKRAWLAGAKEALWASHGVSVSLSPNDGDWDDFTAHRASRGLRRRERARS